MQVTMQNNNRLSGYVRRPVTLPGFWPITTTLIQPDGLELAVYQCFQLQTKLNQPTLTGGVASRRNNITTDSLLSRDALIVLLTL